MAKQGARRRCEFCGCEQVKERGKWKTVVQPRGVQYGLGYHRIHDFSFVSEKKEK